MSEQLYQVICKATDFRSEPLDLPNAEELVEAIEQWRLPRDTACTRADHTIVKVNDAGHG